MRGSLYNPGGLISGDGHNALAVMITLVAGQNLPRGAVLGKVTATGKYVLSTAAAVDGSQTPDMILAEDTDASAGDRYALAYHTGHFCEYKLTLGAGHTADSIREGLRLKKIFLINN